MTTDESIFAINPKLLDISTIDYGDDGIGLTNDEIFELLTNSDSENDKSIY
jgi:hypothetical protein